MREETYTNIDISGFPLPFPYSGRRQETVRKKQAPIVEEAARMHSSIAAEEAVRMRGSISGRRLRKLSAIPFPGL